MKEYRFWWSNNQIPTESHVLAENRIEAIKKFKRETNTTNEEILNIQERQVVDRERKTNSKKQEERNLQGK